jgi:predicted kinase
MHKELEEKTYLIILVGHAGSGKSFFARQLANKKHWVRFNGDSMRMALFGSLEAMQEYSIEFKRFGIFRAVDYAVKQVLLAKKSVIYDANNNRKDIRIDKYKLAHSLNAIPVTVWIQTSTEIAIERTKTRNEDVDQRKFTHDKALEVVSRHIANLDEPTPDERTIIVNGESSFDEQFRVFEEEIRKF